MNRTSRLQIRRLTDWLWVCLLLALAAFSAPAMAALTATPSSLNILARHSVTVAITGATGTLSATSADSSVVAVSLIKVTSNSATLVVTALAAGSTGISIRSSRQGRITVPVTVIAPATLALTPTSATLIAGASAKLTASHASGALTVSSSNAGVATASVVGNTITVFGVAAGSALVSVRDGSSQASAAITVEPGMTVSPAALSLVAGQRASLSASNAAGAITATSGNSALASATVSASLISVQGLAAGATAVVVSDGKTSVSVPIAVSAAMSVAPNALSMVTGQSASLTAINAAAPIAAASSNAAVATVGVSGNVVTVTGVSAGTATVALSDGITTLSVAVNVAPKMSLAPASLALYTGSTGSLTATNAAAAIAAASSNTAVGTVAVNGNVVTVSAVAVGSAVVSVSDGITTLTANVSVSAGLAASPSSVSVAAGSSTPISASNVAGTLSAQSGDVSVATVSLQGNVVTVAGIQAGATTITLKDNRAAVIVPVTVTSIALAGRFSLIAWNDLGMHCMDGKDYSMFSILPPYNNLHAQLVNATTGKAVTSGVTITYEAVADPTGSINTTSAGKTNFWNWVQPLYGASPAQNLGLTGNATPSLTPKPLVLDAANQWFEASGIPITPYDDQGTKNYYPTVKLSARDGSGKLLASTTTVLPVSDEITCAACHASRAAGETNVALVAARPAAGWTQDANAELDWKKNILRLHDEKQAANPKYVSALSTKGMPAGLYASALSGKPVLCASCHASNALPGTGLAGVSTMTSAQHSSHGKVVDPATMQSMDSSTNRSACYACHPGSVTKCLRGAMGDAVDANGNAVMGCQSCHGNMSKVGHPTRVGWLEEPTCQACHYNGQRTTSALDAAGNLVVPTDTRFATNANAPVAGSNLFRFSKGHGGMQCEACHGATHAEYPSSHANDNLQSIALQGYAGTLRECSVCHASTKISANGGPHGMHSVGASWVSGHHDYINAAGGRTACAYCHGADYRGTPLSQVKVARSYRYDGRTVNIPAGTNVGCYTCHNGPGGG